MRPPTTTTVRYERTGHVARLTLDRPERGNGLTRTSIEEVAALVEHADLDPQVRVMVLAGNGPGFCGGYDLVDSAEQLGGAAASGGPGEAATEDVGPAGGGEVAAPHDPRHTLPPTAPEVMAANHDPGRTWDPMVDHAMMSRNVRAFMSLFHAATPVICQVHGFCVGGGTDLALCSDLLVIAEDARIGYPPARVWGSPTTSMWTARLGPQRAKRLLFTGDCLTGREALDWGLAIEAPPVEELADRVDALAARIAQLPLNQLQMMKLLVNQQVADLGLAPTQLIGTVFDGIARHTPEGYAFQRHAATAGFRAAVRDRDEPFGDVGRSMRSS